MKQKIKSLIIYSPKIILFCFALYNFASLWFEASRGPSGLVSPWYKDWSYYNEPSLLLYAAIFLLFKNRFSNLISSVLSGSVIAYGVYLISRFSGWLEWFKWLPKHWKFIRELEFDILKEWEIQLILATFIFGFSIFYFIREKSRGRLLL